MNMVWEAFAGGDDRQKVIPCEREKVHRIRFEDPLKVFWSTRHGSHALTLLMMSESYNARPEGSLSCLSLRSFHTPVTVMKVSKGEAG